MIKALNFKFRALFFDLKYTKNKFKSQKIERGANEKRKEGIDNNNYLGSIKQPYPIDENNKNIINNIKNKRIYNNSLNSNKKSNYKGRDYTNFDFTKLYANAEAFG